MGYRVVHDGVGEHLHEFVLELEPTHDRATLDLFFDCCQVHSSLHNFWISAKGVSYFWRNRFSIIEIWRHKKCYEFSQKDYLIISIKMGCDMILAAWIAEMLIFLVFFSKLSLCQASFTSIWWKIIFRKWKMFLPLLNIIRDGIGEDMCILSRTDDVPGTEQSPLDFLLFGANSPRSLLLLPSFDRGMLQVGFNSDHLIARSFRVL